MDFLWEQITDWLKEVLVSGNISNLTGMFDSTNEQIGEIAGVQQRCDGLRDGSIVLSAPPDAKNQHQGRQHDHCKPFHWFLSFLFGSSSPGCQ